MERPRWPVAAGATFGLIVVVGLIVYNLIPATIPTLILRPLPRAGVAFDTGGTRTGPATPIPDARRGGAVRVLRTAPLATDLTQPVPDADRSALRLQFRTLTAYVRTSAGLELVGDLATDTGHVSTDGLSWTYHLRHAIRFEDGSAITSADVARGIARSTDLSVGTPDATTVVVTVTHPLPALPLLLSRVETTPARPGPDLLASGPYRRVSSTLQRNPDWDPASDPVRHGYPDTIDFEVASPAAVASRLASTNPPLGSDASAVSDAVPPGVVRGGRRVLGPTGVGTYVLINTVRVTDLNVRRALNFAIDRAVASQSIVDSSVLPMTTILPSLLRGPHTYDAYPAGPRGNLDRARRLLVGRFIPKLTMCSDPSTVTSGLDDVLRRSFAQAGITVTVSEVSLTNYHPDTTVCDLIPVTVSAAYPDAGQFLDSLFGTFSTFPEPAIGDRLTALAADPDRLRAAPDYVTLDETVMRDYAPVVPVVERVAQAVVGPAIGTAEVDPVTGTLDLDSVSIAG
jgi:peptide/nickel transport system substrate-binding protein